MKKKYPSLQKYCHTVNKIYYTVKIYGSLDNLSDKFNQHGSAASTHLHT